MEIRPAFLAPIAMSAVLAVFALPPSGAADPAAPAAGPDEEVHLDVKEVTVFKDGHAFVLEEGEAPADASGAIVLDRLPAPVLGTFWAYAADPRARLRSVTAGKRERTVERTALTIRDLLEANVGVEALFTEAGGARYAGTIAAVPEAKPDERERPGPAEGVPPPSRKGSIVLIRTDGGTKSVGIDRIQDVTFLGACKTALRGEEPRPTLTLALDWADGKPAQAARVGMGYIQKGLRWIPGYRIELDGKGGAVAKLQATLVNELVDLDGVTVNLVIGVPGIAFKEALDPIALGRTLAPLSQYFQEDSGTRYALSNAIMSQQARMGEVRRPGREPGAEAVPEIPGGDGTPGAGTEDLFIFTVRGVSLRKGERMVLPVTEVSLRYRDVFTLDLPFSPPPELGRNLNTEQQRELARLFKAPKAVHKVRLENGGRAPLTTAPALVLEGGRLIAQSLLTYTPPGGTSDIALTKAVNIPVRRSDVETKRTPGAERWNGHDFARIDLSGKIVLASHLQEAAEVEVTRSVLGRGDGAEKDGSLEQLGIFEEGGVDPEMVPVWWNWYSWPGGWHHLNGLARFTWKVRLEPGKTAELEYRWHYFWP